jgi:MYXO-CTERM domain-containing protein
MRYWRTVRTSIRLVALASFILPSGLAVAHTTLTYPPPRTLSNKAEPCGASGSVRGDTVSTFKPGETITVTWDETVDHPGHYRIAFDTDGDDDFPNPNTPDDAFPSVLVDQIPDRSGGGLYSQDITFPDVECDNCTLQLIQIMTTSVPYNSFYYQCADITLSSSAPDGPDGGTGGGGGGGGSSPSGGCAVGGSGRAPVVPLALSLVALVALRARRRR